MSTLSTDSLREKLNEINDFVLSNQDKSLKFKEVNGETLNKIFSIKGYEKPSWTYSPLMISNLELEKLISVSTLLFETIEELAENLHNDELLMKNEYAIHQKYYPYLKKTGPFWQGVSRYDFIITPRGEVKFIELNTSCPAGVMLYSELHAITKKYLCENIKNKTHLYAQPLDDHTEFARLLCQMEILSGFEPKCVAILYDENQILLELETIKNSFEQFGRKAFLADARSLSIKNNELTFESQSISLSYNKFRVSDIIGHWSDPIEINYKNYLSALKNGSFLGVNNIMCNVFMEDKETLSLLAEKIQENKDPYNQFLLDHIPWTCGLRKSHVIFQGEEYNPIDLLEKYQDYFVVKPRNFGRGVNVYIGCAMTKADWKEALSSISMNDYIAQEFIEPINVPIAYANGKISLYNMNQTGSIFMINGQFFGIISRVSKDLITNVGQRGAMQPVIIYSV